MELAIIGLPTSGKTTVFNALTGGDRPTHAASTGKVETHAGVVSVPDARLAQLAELLGPPKRIAAQITFVDTAGLGGTELSGELRNRLEQMDGLLHVVRAFGDERVPHPAGRVDAQRDLDTLDAELALADLLLVENRLARIADEMGKGKGDRGALGREQAVLERLKATLEESIPLRDVGLAEEERTLLRGYGLLTLKPVLVLVNTDDESPPGLRYDHAHSGVLAMQGQVEMELAQLGPEEAAPFMAEYGLAEMASPRVIREAYALLGLHTFFTFNEDEVRAWPVAVGATALEAAGAIHSDIARGFIRAEVGGYEALVEVGGWNALKSGGQLRVEGRDYVVQDGDVMLVRFNV